jgi:mannose-1-phosphate guanylyltransferase
MDSDYQKHLFALIVIGGGGTRLWPKSRNATPKQFLKLFNNKSMAQITTQRFHKLVPWEKIFVVTTTEGYKKEFLKEIPEIPSENVLVEPCRRNTAPAHGLGALYIFSKDPDAVIVNDYSDHLINPEENYLGTMKAAAAACYSGDYLLATGIKPTYPNTGYGYVKRGAEFKKFEGRDIYKLDKFTEKPELEVAKEYLASGDYFWNAGQFVWRADSFLKALEKCAPDIYKPLMEVKEVIGKGPTEEKEAIAKAYEKMPEISVDYAVAEKSDNFITIVADYNWTDIGDWKEVWQNLPRDKDNNVIITGGEYGGEVMNIGTTDAMIHTDGRLIVVIDVDNIIIIDTEDALLVCAKDKAQDVKKIVEKLKEDKRTKLL